MGDSPSSMSFEAIGLSVQVESRLNLVTLRYFGLEGQFVRVVQQMLNSALPDTGRAKFIEADSQLKILAWRAPTECILMGADDWFVESLRSATVSLNDGCLVDQSAGFLVIRVSGEAVDGLFARLGGQLTLPALGQTCRSRLADVPVTALKVRSNETHIIVERSYGAHLLDSIRDRSEDLGLPLFD
jgi:sarcosine oxidase gamma subunit